MSSAPFSEAAPKIVRLTGAALGDGADVAAADAVGATEARSRRRGGAADAGRDDQSEDGQEADDPRPHGRGLLGRRHLDHHVGGLDDTDRLVADLETHVVHGLGRHEADHPVRAGLDLDDRCDAVLLDPGDDAGEPVARRSGDDGALDGRLATLVHEPGDLVHLDQPLAALRAGHREAAVGLPATERLDRHAEHLGGLPDAQTAAFRSGRSSIPRKYRHVGATCLDVSACHGRVPGAAAASEEPADCVRRRTRSGRRGIIRGHPPVAQWIRATDFGSVGRGFESLRAGHVPARRDGVVTRNAPGNDEARHYWLRMTYYLDRITSS